MHAPLRAGALLCAALAGVAALLAAPEAAAQPAASITAKRDAVMNYVRAVERQRQSLVGVQINEYEVFIECTSYHRVIDLTGQRPALMGLELMFAIEYPPYRDYLTDRALEQTANGGLVTLAWHQRNPVEVCPRGEFYECSKKPMSAETMRAMLTPGTREHALWLADVEAIAALFADWKARGIVVLWRPYHEMNGNWFWWGNTDLYPELWDALYEELAVKRGLDNLIWVWSGDRETPNSRRYFPRRHAPDIVGVDVYENDFDSPKYAAGRASITQHTPRAPFALTEIGVIPSARTFDAINPAWVLLWGGEFLNGEWAWNNDCTYCNRPERVREFIASPRALMLDEIPAAVRASISANVTRGAALRPENPSCPARLR